MAEVELLLPALPEHVRTARLVTVAAARRAGLAGELVDELRLAVGEACARAVGLHARYAPDERVQVVIADGPVGLTVRVTDCGPEAGPAVDDVTGGLLEAGSDETGASSPDPSSDLADLADPDVALALVTGLVDEVEVSRSAGGTTVSLTWPLRVRPSTGSAAAQ
jgi:anti-sigma regulatory factor (Ser/Thr protein kinase)